MSTTETATPIGIANVSLEFPDFAFGDRMLTRYVELLAPQPAVCIYEKIEHEGNDKGLIF